MKMLPGFSIVLKMFAVDRREAEVSKGEEDISFKFPIHAQRTVRVRPCHIYRCVTRRRGQQAVIGCRMFVRSAHIPTHTHTHAHTHTRSMSRHTGFPPAFFFWIFTDSDIFLMSQIQ